MSWFTSLNEAISIAATYGISAASLARSAKEKRKLDSEISDLIEKIEDLKKVIQRANPKLRRAGSPSREITEGTRQAVDKATSELDKLEKELNDKLLEKDYRENPEKYKYENVSKELRAEKRNIPSNCLKVPSKINVTEPFAPGLNPPHTHATTDRENEASIKDLIETHTEIDKLYTFFTDASRKDEDSLEISTKRFDDICLRLLSYNFDIQNPFRPNVLWKYNKIVQIYVVYILKKILIIHYAILQMKKSGNYSRYTSYLNSEFERKLRYKRARYYLYNIKNGDYRQAHRNNSTRRVNHRGSRSRSRSRNRNGVFTYENQQKETIEELRIRLVLHSNPMTIEKLMYIFEKILYGKILYGKDYQDVVSSKFYDVINTWGFEHYLMKLLLATKKEYADIKNGSYDNCFNIHTFEKVKFEGDNDYTKEKINGKGYDEIVSEFRDLHENFKKLKGMFEIRAYKD